MKKGLLLVAALLVSACLNAKDSSGPYQPTFASLEQATPTPEWFKDAKFGIYFHWGVYSVPAFANEWYPRSMYITGSTENRHHLATYGTLAEWPYDHFITGDRDKQGRWVQFAPKLKSAGGQFDPDEWAQLFADAGAKFAGPVAEHHDGFSLWASKVNPWNAQDMGPHLDLVRLLTDAIRRHDLKVFLSMHHAFNITGYYSAVPKTDDPKLQILYGQQGKEKNEALWLAKHKEIIDGYHPDIIYQDFNLHLISQPVLLGFLAYYYNQAATWHKEVVATFKDGLTTQCAVLDYERGGPADIVDDYWLTDDAISSSSWCYTTGLGYYSTQQILHGFIDRISKNGNMVLDIAPMADGTIPAEQKEILHGLGSWLHKYGEAIYATRAWARYGEGPTRMGAAHGVMGPPRAGTAHDIRYTRSKDNSTLYAIMLGWDDGQAGVDLSLLSSRRIDGTKLQSAELIDGAAGKYRPLPFTQDDQGLHLKLPARPFDELAYVIKLSFAGGIPAFNNFAEVDPSHHYHLVPAGGSGDLVLGAAGKLTGARKDPANQWGLKPVRKGIYAFLSRKDGATTLACDAATHSLAPARFTGVDAQLWKIDHAHNGQVVISSVADRRLRLALAAAAADGVSAVAASSEGKAPATWQLAEVCDMKQEPFKPHLLPGTIEAEDYDLGCPGDAYRDSDDINEGGLYRPDSGVDIGSVDGGGYTLGWTHAGEWTAYTVTVAKSGTYRVSFRVASGQTGARFHLESDGADLTGPIDVPNTNGFQNWIVIERTVRLDAGAHVLHVVIDGDFVNLGKMDFVATE
ncbi:MAG TPA: alpha-L-fucosidase [Lacunisphaera sp.]|nr:alpha-L-fucosidase [Lacunisphaera sp.]